MEECIFCKIAQAQMKSTIVFSDDEIVAFRDINPQAPKHILVIPKTHIAGPLALDEVQAPVMGELFLAAKFIATQAGFAEAGYRLVMNQGRQGGQSVYHMHLHILGGRQMAWPPG